jgi:hypothetical protein
MGRADRPDGFDLRPTRDLVRHVGVRRIMRNGVDAGLGHDSPGLYSCAMAVLQSIFIDDSGRVPARSHSRQAGPKGGEHYRRPGRSGIIQCDSPRAEHFEAILSKPSSNSAGRWREG